MNIFSVAQKFYIINPENSESWKPRNTQNTRNLEIVVGWVEGIENGDEMEISLSPEPIRTAYDGLQSGVAFFPKCGLRSSTHPTTYTG